MLPKIVVIATKYCIILLKKQARSYTCSLFFFKYGILEGGVFAFFFGIFALFFGIFAVYLVICFILNIKKYIHVFAQIIPPCMQYSYEYTTEVFDTMVEGIQTASADQNVAH